MEPDVGAQLVHDRAIARDHVDAEDGAQRFLERRFLLVGSLGGLDRHRETFEGNGIFERLNQRREIHRDGAIFHVILQGAIVALVVFQFRPVGLWAIFPEHQRQGVGIQKHFEYFFRSVGELEGIEKTNGVGFLRVRHILSPA